MEHLGSNSQVFKNTVKVGIFILFSVLTVSMFSACSSLNVFKSPEQKAEESFRKALDAIRINDQQNAIKYSQEALSHNPDYLQPNLLLAEVYNFRDNRELAKKHYLKVFELNPMYDPSISLNLALYKFESGKYDRAKSFIDFFFEHGDPKKQTQFDSERLKNFIYFSVDAVQNPVPFEPISLGPGVNSQYDEYWPSLSADERVLVFTRQIPVGVGGPGPSGTRKREDLYVSYYTERGWSTGIPLPGEVNTHLNEGAQCISADGNTVIITACNRPGGVGSCDLYILFKKEDGKWTSPQNMRSVNSRWWDSNPSLSADGRTLYFSSARPGGDGGSNIWKVNINSEGEAISDPEILPPTINTSFDEVSPFIHPDGRTLYFASNGHIGLGDYDLFLSRLDDDGNWSEPENLGYPINTHAEERSLIVNARGDIAMFASAREPGRGLDIYYFEMPYEIRPTTVTYVKGFVYDAKTKERLQADLELIDLSNGNIVAKQKSDRNTGEYLVCLPIDRDYAFNASKQGYLFYSENFSLTGLKHPEKPYVMNIPLNPIEEGVAVVMRNIFFEFDSYELLPESFAELNRITAFLIENPNIKIEIGGHTDNVGSMAYNKALSENRAKAVYKYFTEMGISSQRLSYKGYYFSQPIAENETEEGRAKNRRTEFKIIGIL